MTAQTRALVEAWMSVPLSRLIADRAYDGDAFRVWLAQRGIQTVIPARAGHLDPSPCDSGRRTKRATRSRLAQEVTARGHPLRQTRPLFPGFSVLGGYLDLAESKYSHGLI